ncbi:hypothetical protein DL96DRAFT_1611834 [Flagelloscypha sp. PMI_526]|nr:hypothetical protein DL96DRAFT_1611834 [Flagelloscypha sp. PMI_526]
MASPRVPLELMSLIFSFLRDDYDNLATCSLVSQDCRWFSQPYIFRHVHIYGPVHPSRTPNVVQKFVKLLKRAPHIIAWVKSLYLGYGSLLQIHEVQSILRALPNIQKLAIRGPVLSFQAMDLIPHGTGALNPWTRISPGIVDCLRTYTFPSIVSLSLVNIDDIPLENILQDCPRLQCLSLDCAHFSAIETQSGLQVQRRSQTYPLNSLCMAGTSQIPLLPSYLDAVTITKVSLGRMGTLRSTYVLEQPVWEHIRATLITLQVDSSLLKAGFCLELQMLPNLQHLIVSTTIPIMLKSKRLSVLPAQTPQHLDELESVSGSIRELKEHHPLTTIRFIAFVFMEPTYSVTPHILTGRRARTLWNGLDEALESASLSVLREVSFDVEISFDLKLPWDGVVQAIHRTLPTTSKRGLLKIREKC